MIKYYDAHKAFILTGKNYSYVLYVNGMGCLQMLHFGSGICEGDLPYMIAHIGNACVPPADDLNKDMRTDVIPLEYGSYARGDYREPTAIIERSDGASMSRFRYTSHTIVTGTPEIKNLPHARRGGQTLSVIMEDDFSHAEIILCYTVWDDLDVLVRNAEIKNTGHTPIMLKKAYSFCLDLPERKYRILRLHGTWAKERYPEVSDLGHGTVRVQSLRGASSHQMNPFMGILGENCTETDGECYGFQMIYSGSFAITAERNSNGAVRLQGGINEIGFGWEIQGGESFATPQAAICYSARGLGELSRGYADFIREHIIDSAWVFARRPIVINNWEATYFDFDSDKLIKIIDEAAMLGIDTFVLDDGWFGKRDNDKGSLGDWFVNEKKLRGGLKPIIDRCKKNNLKFGIWFEPEMISEDSEIFRVHPDWAIKKDGIEPVRGRNQLVLDFTRKDVVEHVFKSVSKILAENDISYVKWDMNRNITECYSQSLPMHRQGEFMHRYILGVYDLAERLTNTFPNVFFEGCAGGGGRFDAGMLYYFPQIWTSDDTDGYERTKIQWGTSVCYPVSSMSCHVSDCPNHQTQRITPLATRGAVASLGAFGYELDLSKLTKEEKSQIVVQIANYKSIENLVLKGDLYRISDPFTENYFCEMLVSKDKLVAYVVGERFYGDPCDRDRILRLNGLDENKIYRIKELNLTASGKALMSVGLYYPRLSDYGSWVWHLQALSER